MSWDLSWTQMQLTSTIEFSQKNIEYFMVNYGPLEVNESITNLLTSSTEHFTISIRFQEEIFSHIWRQCIRWYLKNTTQLYE